MRRREFITLVGGTAAMWSLAARAQNALPVIGFLHPTSPDAFPERLREFRQGLKEAGFVDGANVMVTVRFAENQPDRLSALARELVNAHVAVIVAANGPAILAAKAATMTTPIVFIAPEDPVKLGLVASLSRPGGNLSGINFVTGELAAKRLEFLRELVPGMARMAVLVNRANVANTESTVRDVDEAARAIGLKIQILNASTSQEVNVAFATIVRERHDALFVSSDPFFTSRRVQLAILAARHSIPTAYATREIPEIGGLMSYGANVPDAWHQAGAYAGRVLKGAKPADMPVVQAAKFEFVINTSTAQALGLTVPPTLLARADEVIE
jgi:putative ABC transport system substrate-binding protein